MYPHFTAPGVCVFSYWVCVCVCACTHVEHALKKRSLTVLIVAILYQVLIHGVGHL